MSDIDLVAALRGAVEAAQQRAESEGNGREKGSISGPDLNLDWRDCLAIRTHHGATLVRIGDTDLWTDLEDGFQFSPNQVATLGPTPLLDQDGLPIAEVRHA